MAFTVYCPKCNTGLKAEAEYIGKRANCKQCGHKFFIESPSKQASSFKTRVYRPNWFWTAPFALSFSFFLVACTLIGMVAGGYRYVGVWALLFLFTVPILKALLYSYSVSLEVSNKKTTLTKGLLSQRVIEVWHKDVRNIYTYQSLFQRIVGIGAIGISSAGQNDIEIKVAGLPGIKKLKDLLNDLKGRYE